MKKAPVGFSVLILLIGVIVFSYSNQFLETPDNDVVEQGTDLPYGSWRVSAAYSEGEELLVYFRAPSGDRMYPEDPKILVNITDPLGGNTTFQVIFIISPSAGEANISLLHEGDGLIVENPDFEIGGVTVYEGDYTAYAYTEAKALASLYYDDAELPFLQLLKVYYIREYPNQAFLPVGIGLLIAGLALLVWGVKSS